MMPVVRVAMFSPLPPVRSGIADYSVELLGRLGHAHVVDVFVGSTDEIAAWPEDRGPFRVLGAHDFVWRRVRTPYDLVIYQMGNARCHDYMWPYLFRWPGLVVLHDAHLHHARAGSLLRRDREDDYRAELAYNHPQLLPDAAGIALSGFAGALYYLWPMLRAVADSARMLAVHNARLAAELAAAFPHTPVRAIPMGVAEPAATPEARQAIRDRWGLAPDAIVLTAFGAVTPEKRIDAILQALAVVRRYSPGVRLLLVGQTMAHFDAEASARALGVADLVTQTGFVSDEDLPAYLAASDVVLSLRWPTARETSASWLRAIAAGRATIVTALADQAELPTLDPRSWTVVHARPTFEPQQAAAVSIDVMDETRSLTLAIKRLVADGPLRASIGAAARRHWKAWHSIALMSDGYVEAIADAARLPDPAPALPSHLRPDGAAHARALLAEIGGQSLDWS